MKRNGLLLVVFFLLSIPQPTFAWGYKGHAIIAEIAFRYLDEQTKKNVMAYLDGMSIEDAANWMDKMRSDPSYDFMKPYHYVDFDPGQPATNLSGDNIIGVLNATLADLNIIQKLSNAEIKTKLLYLFHLIGDLHQPLHVGYPEDKGGNTYQVSFFGQGSNLHKTWDSEIIDYEHTSLQDVLSTASLTPRQITAIQEINILSWANESRSFLGKVYSIQGHKISEEYIAIAYPVIEKQLLYAGIRLAAVLEKYFRNAAPLPKPFVTATPASITPEEASNHVGETLTVCGKVYGGKYLENSNGSPTLINMGAAYPSNPFTIVIFGSDRGNFSYQPEEYLTAKTICVTGLIKLYKGKPEIVVSQSSQIQVK